MDRTLQRDERTNTRFLQAVAARGRIAPEGTKQFKSAWSVRVAIPLSAMPLVVAVADDRIPFRETHPASASRRIATYQSLK